MAKISSNKSGVKNLIKQRKTCQSIIQISNKIRYVGIINQYGRTVTGVLRPDAKPLLNVSQVKTEFFLIASMLRMRSDFTGKTIGNLEHAIIQHEKIFVILVYTKGFTYYVSIDKSAKDVTGILGKIKKVIKRE